MVYTIGWLAQKILWNGLVQNPPICARKKYLKPRIH